MNEENATDKNVLIQIALFEEDMPLEVLAGHMKIEVKKLHKMLREDLPKAEQRKIVKIIKENSKYVQ